MPLSLRLRVPACLPGVQRWAPPSPAQVVTLRASSALLNHEVPIIGHMPSSWPTLRALRWYLSPLYPVWPPGGSWRDVLRTTGEPQSSAKAHPPAGIRREGGGGSPLQGCPGTACPPLPAGNRCSPQAGRVVTGLTGCPWGAQAEPGKAATMGW